MLTEKSNMFYSYLIKFLGGRQNIERQNIDMTKYRLGLYIQLDTRKHLTVPKVVELFRREQNKVDSDKLRIKNGDQFKPKTGKHETNLRILRLVTDYKSENIEAFLEDYLFIVSFGNISIHRKNIKIKCKTLEDRECIWVFGIVERFIIQKD
ncbi:hypothetical protein BpHYR1_054446 [Brachionus plicatilis]|uniref:Uncharacterized protein n=1 Tax=Brachionus plicatilis TaxID=10195 RepID=A0A3M7R3Q8_BRAPC|nr:hypothetical protein BpHYR1_054446 [Brachionus plicatilis]